MDYYGTEILELDGKIGTVFYKDHFYVDIRLNNGEELTGEVKDARDPSRRDLDEFIIDYMIQRDW